MLYLDLPSRRNTQRTGRVLVLLVYYLPFLIKGRPMCCSWFLLYLSSFLFLGASLALRRIANEDTGDRGKVFVCVIRVVYRILVFYVSNRISNTEACFFKRVGRSIVNNHCMGVLEYSLTGRYSTLSENEIFIDFI